MPFLRGGFRFILDGFSQMGRVGPVVGKVWLDVFTERRSSCLLR